MAIKYIERWYSGQKQRHTHTEFIAIIANTKTIAEIWQSFEMAFCDFMRFYSYLSFIQCNAFNA